MFIYLFITIHVIITLNMQCYSAILQYTEISCLFSCLFSCLKPNLVRALTRTHSPLWLVSNSSRLACYRCRDWTGWRCWWRWRRCYRFYWYHWIDITQLTVRCITASSLPARRVCGWSSWCGPSPAFYRYQSGRAASSWSTSRAPPTTTPTHRYPASQKFPKNH